MTDASAPTEFLKNAPGEPLRYCYNCLNPETGGGGKLKKCGGCSVTLYCSPACQRAGAML